MNTLNSKCLPFLRKSLSALTTLCILANWLSAPSAHAVSLYWDTSGSPTDPTYGGSGTWNTSNAYWNDSPTIGSGTTLTAWNNAASPLDAASFLRGYTDTVTVSGTVTALAVFLGSSTGSFTTGSGAYTLTGGTLDLRQTVFGSDSITNTTGDNIVNSAITLWGAASPLAGAKITSSGGTLTINGGISDGGLTSAHNFTMAAFSGATLAINGNFTKSGASPGITLNVGSNGTANNVFYSLGGNNTGITSAATFNRGTLTLNSSTALAGAGSVILTVANANVGGSADTANLLIGTAGVTISNGITFTTLGTDTTDIRSIGGSNTSGTATYSNTITLGAFAASGTGSSLRVTSASGGTTVFSGNITDSTATVPLLLNGTGIVKFTRGAGMNYDGGTTVSTGTLLVSNTSGSGTGTGAVSVSSGATLGGTGIITGATTISGIASPGDVGSIGQLNITNNVTWNGGASAGATTDWVFALGASNISDLLNITGNFLKGTGSAFRFDFGAATDTGTFKLVDWSGTTDFSIGNFSYTNLGGSNTGTFQFNGTQLEFVAVPEPSTEMAIVFGAGMLMTLRMVGRRKN